jgi:hypothetical protein
MLVAAHLRHRNSRDRYSNLNNINCLPAVRRHKYRRILSCRGPRLHERASTGACNFSRIIAHYHEYEGSIRNRLVFNSLMTLPSGASILRLRLRHCDEEAPMSGLRGNGLFQNTLSYHACLTRRRRTLQQNCNVVACILWLCDKEMLECFVGSRPWDWDFWPVAHT